MRGSGNNAHEGMGNGSNVGEHQDATEIKPMTFNGSSDGMYANVESKNGYYSTKNIDYGVYGTRSGYISSGTYNLSSSENSMLYYITRPTNTSVLYCIKYEPTYFIKNTNTFFNYDEYSEEEKIIGKWIDGKPIYRKFVYVGDNLNVPQGGFALNDNNKFSNLVNNLNIDWIINSNFILKEDNATLFSNGGFLYKLQDKYKIFSLDSWEKSENRHYYMIIEYTKTTDTPLDDTDIQSTAEQDAQDIYEDMFN